MKLSKKAAFVLGAFLLSTPMIFADAKLNKEIALSLIYCQVKKPKICMTIGQTYVLCYVGIWQN